MKLLFVIVAMLAVFVKLSSALAVPEGDWVWPEDVDEPEPDSEYPFKIEPRFAAAEECQPIGGYCQVSEQCCTKRCLSYRARCVS